MSGGAKRALVTGGSAGLGAALVRWLTANGFEVLVLDRHSRQAGTPDVRDEAERSVGHLHCDFANRDDLDRVLPQLFDHGPFDVVALNAGASAPGHFERIDLATHLKVLRVNTEAPLVIAAGLLQAKAFNPGAAMLFVSSLSHFTGYPGAASCAASKDALAVYAKSMRKVAKVLGVSITVAFPEPLRTDHAERDAAPGADAARRMEPELAAARIMADAVSGRKTSISGASNRAFALIGKIAPKPVTALMRRLVYLRLDR